METAKVDIRRLQLLNDRVNQCIDALNQVRLSVHGLSHTGGTVPGVQAGFGQFAPNPYFGFGAQSLVRDYLNGTLILIENQYSKGDVVSIAGVSGAVEDFSLRRTTLRDLDGVVHTVPNGEVKVASNRTRTWARINQNITVAFGTDIDKAIGVVDELGRQMHQDPVWKRRILEPPRVERVESIEERGITLKILGTVRASEQWAAGGEFRKLLLQALAKNGIQLPRPPQVVVAQPDGTDGVAVGAAPTQDDLADE